jgi:hypothetical protein
MKSSAEEYWTEAPDVPDVPAPEVNPPPVARPLADLVRHNGDDPGELLRHRFLCRGAGLLLCGPTGIGKSSLALQLALCWALARECFGIAPARSLKSLFVQSENDDGDLCEIRDGILAGLTLTAAEAKQACAAVTVAREDQRTGVAFFFETVRPLLAAHKPDLLWIDPALAYLGGEANAQKDVGGFLRNGLNPLLAEFQCGNVTIHHTNKPASGREKPTWQAGDFAYLGAGSAEWANWARAVLALRSIGSHEVFELQAGKRGGRLGWQQADGAKLYTRYLAHATEPGVICWQEVNREDVQLGGRPKDYDEAELLELLPPEGLTSGDWLKAAEEENGVSRRSFFRQRQALEKAKKILKSKVSGKWQPVSKKP